MDVDASPHAQFRAGTHRPRRQARWSLAPAALPRWRVRVAAVAAQRVPDLRQADDIGAVLLDRVLDQAARLGDVVRLVRAGIHLHHADAHRLPPVADGWKRSVSAGRTQHGRPLPVYGALRIMRGAGADAADEGVGPAGAAVPLGDRGADPRCLGDAGVSTTWIWHVRIGCTILTLLLFRDCLGLRRQRHGPVRPVPSQPRRRRCAIWHLYGGASRTAKSGTTPPAAGWCW